MYSIVGPSTTVPNQPDPVPPARPGWIDVIQFAVLAALMIALVVLTGSVPTAISVGMALGTLRKP